MSLVNAIAVASVTLGSPLTVRFDTTQLVGVIVSVLLSEPVPELLSVRLKSPETLIVPPDGHVPVYEMGKLQVCPFDVGVQPDAVSGSASRMIFERRSCAPAGTEAPVNEFVKADCTAMTNSCEMACACAFEIELLLELPHEVNRDNKKRLATKIDIAEVENRRPDIATSFSFAGTFKYRQSMRGTAPAHGARTFATRAERSTRSAAGQWRESHCEISFFQWSAFGQRFFHRSELHHSRGIYFRAT